MLLREARDGFLFDCECRHLAKGSIRNYRAETKFLMEFLELKQITEVEDVKAHHIRDFMKQKQDSGNTACYVNDILKACKTWFNYLVEEDYIEERRNPAAKVKYLKQPKTIIETCTKWIWCNGESKLCCDLYFCKQRYILCCTLHCFVKENNFLLDYAMLPAVCRGLFASWYVRRYCLIYKGRMQEL